MKNEEVLSLAAYIEGAPATGAVRALYERFGISAGETADERHLAACLYAVEEAEKYRAGDYAVPSASVSVVEAFYRARYGDGKIPPPPFGGSSAVHHVNLLAQMCGAEQQVGDFLAGLEEREKNSERRR